MSKKIDIKRTLGKKTPPLSIDDVEEMTRLIHSKNTETATAIAVENPKMNVEATANSTEVEAIAPAKYEKNTEKKDSQKLDKVLDPQPDKTKRGRKPKLMMETERLLRVSVDLPESLFIQLKIAVIQQQTDMKTYIRQLVEKDMSK